MIGTGSLTSLKKYLPALLLSIVLGGGGYAAATIYIGWDNLWHQLHSVGGARVGAALLLTTLAVLFRFCRWHLFVRVLGCSISWRHNLQIYLSGFALTTTPAKAGELVRSVFLKKHGMSYASSVAALVSERTMDLIVMLGILMLGGLSHPQGKLVSFITLLMIVTLLVLLGFPGILLRMHSTFSKLGTTKITNLLEKMVRLSEQFRLCASGQSLLIGLVLGVLAWSAEGASFFIICRGVMDHSPMIGEAIFIYAFATLAGALSFLPGGLGVAEVTMFALLASFGASNQEAVVITIVTRVVTLWYGVGVGFLMLVRVSIKNGIVRQT
jgi:uncharacterized protein (TIRG00374 family)